GCVRKQPRFSFSPFSASFSPAAPGIIFPIDTEVEPSGIVARPSTESSLWFCFKEGVPMLSAPPAPPIGIFGPDDYVEGERHGCGLWASGYSAALTQAG